MTVDPGTAISVGYKGVCITLRLQHDGSAYLTGCRVISVLNDTCTSSVCVDQFLALRDKF